MWIAWSGLLSLLLVSYGCCPLVLSESQVLGARVLAEVVVPEMVLHTYHSPPKRVVPVFSGASRPCGPV
tara:strand:+ start:13147 stop:13353 length:207 start_codon:yes stop_codon:yes gene_type:complete